MSSDATDRALPAPLLIRKRSKTVRSDSTEHDLLAGDTDELLLARTQLHDREALSKLFDRYADLAFVIAYRILRDHAEAEDLVQDVFLKLFGISNSFDPAKGSARTWIVQFIYRRAFNRRVFLVRRHFYAGTKLEDPKNAKQEGAILNLQDEIEAQVTARQLLCAFEELTEQQRTAIEMHIFEGATLREISERTGETVDNTRHHYYRGLNRLKKIAFALVEGRRPKRRESE